MIRLSAVLPFLLWAVASSEPQPLEAIPDNAWVVVRVSNPSATLAAARKFVERIDSSFEELQFPIPPPVLDVIASGAGEAGGQASDWWFAVIPQPQGPPGIMLAVRTAEPQNFSELLQRAHFLGGQPVQVTEHGRWSLFSSKAVITQIQECLRNGKSVSKVTALPAYFNGESGHIVAFANVAALRPLILIQLLGARAALNAELQPEKFACPDEMKTDALFSEFRRIADAIVGGVESLNTIGASLSFDLKGVKLGIRAHPADGSEVAQFAAALPKSDMALLGKLPEGVLVGIGLSGGLQDWGKWAARIASDAFGYGDEVKAEVDRYLDEMSQITNGQQVAAFNLESQANGIVQWTTLTECSDLQAAKALNVKRAGLVSRLAAPGVSRTFQVSPGSEHYGKVTANVETIRSAFSRSYDSWGFQENATHWMYGEDGMASRIAYLPGLIVRTTGGGTKAFEKAISALARTPEDGLSNLMYVRSRLGGHPCFALLADVTGLSGRILARLGDSTPVPPFASPEELQEIDRGRSYAGISISGDSGFLALDAFLSMEQIQSGWRLGEFMKKRSSRRWLD